MLEYLLRSKNVFNRLPTINISSLLVATPTMRQGCSCPLDQARLQWVTKSACLESYRVDEIASRDDTLTTRDKPDTPSPTEISRMYVANSYRSA